MSQPKAKQPILPGPMSLPEGYQAPSDHGNNDKSKVKKDRAPPIRRKLWERIGAVADVLQNQIGETYAVDEKSAAELKAAHQLIKHVSKGLCERLALPEVPAQ